MKKFFLLAAFLGSATLLAACGGGGGDGNQVAAADARVAVNADNGKAAFTALADESFVFANGVPAFGTNTATTVSIEAPAAAGGAPRFAITTAGGDTATGRMSFGSCKFEVLTSTFDSPSPLVAGATIVIEDCELTLDTAGQAADGVSVDVNAMLSLDDCDSANTVVTVAITAGGKIVLNGKVVGTITLRPVTGVF